jgi:hypothetical protein
VSPDVGECGGVQDDDFDKGDIAATLYEER